MTWHWCVCQVEWASVGGPKNGNCCSLGAPLSFVVWAKLNLSWSRYKNHFLSLVVSIYVQHLKIYICTTFLKSIYVQEKKIFSSS